jgi:hypothetical protein
MAIDNNKDKDKQIEIEWPEELVDTIGQNGNVGVHYAVDWATEDDYSVTYYYDALGFPEDDDTKDFDEGC